MNLLQRHIFKSVFFACAVAAGVFAFVLIVGNAFRDLLGYLVSGQLELVTFAQLLGLLVPFVAVHALPIGMLTAVLLVLGRMSAQHEITAMRASGLGLAHVAKPILVIALLGVVASWGLNFYYAPEARTLYRKTVGEAVRKNPLSMIVEKTFIRDFPGVVVYVGEKQGGRLEDVWIWRLDKQARVTEFLRAKTGTIDYNEEANEMRVALRDTMGDVRNGDQPENFINTDLNPSAGEVIVDIPLGGLFGARGSKQKAKWMTFDQLRERQRTLEAENAPVGERMKVSLAMHEKAAGSLTMLAFALVAIPLGIKVSRKETSANLGLALALALGYYFLTVVPSWLEGAPALRPDLWAWLPPVVFIALGVWMFRRVERI